MQDEVRGYYEIMDHADVEKFRSLHLEKRLLRPEQPGDVMARLVLCAGRELSGKFFRQVKYKNPDIILLIRFN